MLEAAALGAVLASFAVIPGTTPDHFGHRIGGISSVRWVENSQELYALPDRGPGDGTQPYAPRYFVFSVDEGAGRVEARLKRTVLFRDEAGQPFSGLIQTTMTRLDPEGLVVASDGSLFVAEEYGPFVYHFAADGSFLAKAAPPARYLPGKGAGRDDNRGFEGLCMSPDGKTLAALLQSPLAQDGGKSGKSTRMLIWTLPLSSAAPREIRVPMPDADAMPAEWKMKQKDLAYNECEAVSAEEFLLLERDNRGLGADAGVSVTPAYKRAARLRISGDGRGIRTPALDILPVISAGGVDPKTLPVKFESLAWGPVLEGRRTMWTAIDNDFKSGFPTYIFLLHISEK